MDAGSVEIESLRDVVAEAALYIARVHRNGHGLDSGLVMMSKLRVTMGEKRWKLLCATLEEAK